MTVIQTWDLKVILNAWLPYLESKFLTHLCNITKNYRIFIIFLSCQLWSLYINHFFGHVLHVLLFKFFFRNSKLICEYGVGMKKQKRRFIRSKFKLVLIMRDLKSHFLTTEEQKNCLRNCYFCCILLRISILITLLQFCSS